MSKPDQLSVALIGCGAISEHSYVPALSALSSSYSLSVCSLVDPDENRLSVLGNRLPRANKYRSVCSLDSSNTDLAIIASPQRFHAEQAIDLLTKGIHVLCEKPLASNSEEAQAMIKASEDAGRLLSVALFRRYWPIAQYVSDTISSSFLGSPIDFSWSEGGLFNWPAASPSFFRRETSPGGVLADLGAHVLDLLLYWFGPLSSFEYLDDSMGGLEANAILDLRFQNSCTGIVRLSRDTPIANKIIINFQHGSLHLHPGSVDEVLLISSNGTICLKGSLTKIPIDNTLSFSSLSSLRSYSQCFMAQIQNMCSAIRGHEKLYLSADLALPSIELIEKCYLSRNLLPMPWLTDTEVISSKLLSSSSHDH